jgi:hypothetical protein
MMSEGSGTLNHFKLDEISSSTRDHATDSPIRISRIPLIGNVSICSIESR